MNKNLNQIALFFWVRGTNTLTSQPNSRTTHHTKQKMATVNYTLTTVTISGSILQRSNPQQKPLLTTLSHCAVHISTYHTYFLSTVKSYSTGCLQMNGAVSKVNKKFISHLTRAKRTPSAAATVQVPHALPAVRSLVLTVGLRRHLVN